jgi:hypothetical protein
MRGGIRTHVECVLKLKCDKHGPGGGARAI